MKKIYLKVFFLYFGQLKLNHDNYDCYSKIRLSLGYRKELPHCQVYSGQMRAQGNQENGDKEQEEITQ